MDSNMGDVVKNIRDQFHQAYPSDCFYVCKFSATGGACAFDGQNLIDAQLQDKDWLQVFKLKNSSGPILEDADIRQKALPSIYDTKDITDNEVRRNRLCDDLKVKFPNHNVNVFVYTNKWTYAAWGKGCYSFVGANYGSEVVLVFS